MALKANRKRGLSDGAIFQHSWDYTSHGKLTLVEEVMGRTDITPQQLSLVLTSISKNFTKRCSPAGLVNIKESSTVYHKTPDGRDVMDSANLQQICFQFVDDQWIPPDKKTTNHLILAHANFIPSIQLFDQFVREYKSRREEIKDDPEKEKSAQYVTIRIINFMKQWIDVNHTVFKTDAQLAGAFQNFLAYLDSQQDCDKWRMLLENGIMAAEASKKDKFNPATIAKSVKKPKKKEKPFKIQDFDAKEVAEQLTIIDHGLFCCIDMFELQNIRWVSNPDQTPNIEASSSFTNKLTFWIEYQILITSTVKKRVSLINFFLKVAQYLMEMNNFNSLMAFYLALNLGYINKLKSTLKSVATKGLQMLDIMNPLHNFKLYRDHLATLRPPMVLCQEVALKDLLMTHEQGAFFVGEGVLNMRKLDMIGVILEQIRIAQNVKYSFVEKPELLNHLLNIEQVDREQCDTFLKNILATEEVDKKEVS